jgi:hypothetical protein
MTYYKILAKGHRACHGGTHRYTPNRWTKRLPAAACESGYHICTLDQLSRWLYADHDDLLPLEVWGCDAEGVDEVGDKCVAERIRITTHVGTLDEYDLRWLGTEFAISALHNTDDPRVGECINTVRAYSLGMADASDLSAAWSAAESAAWSAAEGARGRAAWSAAESAAWSAAWSAAESAAESAARSAAWSAPNAAESVAWSGAWSAARSAAWSAARSAAESAQGRGVLDYLRDGAR